MSQKTSKLLGRFAGMTGRNYDDLKKWFESLTAPQRDEAVRHMKETLNRAPAPPAMAGERVEEVDEKEMPDEDDLGL